MTEIDHSNSTQHCCESQVVRGRPVGCLQAEWRSRTRCFRGTNQPSQWSGWDVNSGPSGLRAQCPVQFVMVPPSLSLTVPKSGRGNIVFCKEKDRGQISFGFKCVVLTSIRYGNVTKKFQYFGLFFFSFNVQVIVRRDDQIRLYCKGAGKWLFFSLQLMLETERQFWLRVQKCCRLADHSLLEKREGNWSRSTSRNWFWDSYRGCACQLLANFSSVPGNSPKRLFKS